LENRTLMTVSVSVAGATINEIGNVSAFVAPGSGGLSNPLGITLGADGNVYVAGDGGAVLRYNGTTGAYINTFVSQGSGGLAFGTEVGLAFGPDRNLYVASSSTNQVLEYNGSTGVFIQAFVSAGSDGLSQPGGLRFGPDGNLYVASVGSNAILCFQGPLSASPGSPSTFVSSVVPPNTGGGGPNDVIFGPDGNLYVDFDFNNGVFRFQGPLGASPGSPLPASGQSGATFIPVASSTDGNLAAGRGMAFDQEGRFYITDSSDALHRYDANGNFLGDLLIDSVNPELAKPRGMIFDAQGALLIPCNNSNTVVRYDRGVTVSLSAANSIPVLVDYATVAGSATAGKDYIAQSGTVTFAPGQTTREILLATEEEAVLDGNETFSVQMSSDPNDTSGATIANGTATVTIVDPTRSFSIADSSAIEGDHTAHYRRAFVQGIPASGFANLTFGPDGNLYAGGGAGNLGILSYNGTTGALIGTFIPQGPIGEVGNLLFHGGYLYVSDQSTSEVYRFDASTGAFVDVFVAAGSGGIKAAFGMAFDSAGNLYLSGRSSNNVVKYDTNGNPVWTTATGSGGLNLPEGIALDPSGAFLYVASSGSGQVLKYNASTGAYVGVAGSSGVSAPIGVEFGSDGLLYVDNRGNNRILRYTENGTYVDDYVPAGSGGMSNIFSMAFGPDGDLYVAAGSPSQIMRFGTENEALFTVTNTTPSTLPLTVKYATADGTALAGRDYTATSGTLTFAPGVTSETIRVPILDDGIAESGLSFALNLSNPEAATLSRSQATGSITDSDAAARFYVVNDSTTALGGTNTAYEYQASGTEQAPFGLSLNNLSPRGVAANATGTMEWVVDANKNVYVYSSGGALLGSWSAGGLSSSAQLTGIATNGTDIWLVDSYTGKVYKYAGAASLLSGSQNAASSFALVTSKGKSNNGNTNPQDIVTDGTSFWVVDGTALKVFKYTLTGSSLGSWAIDPADRYPTGITINPSNPSDIWIVDNVTDMVYQYIGAVSRTSGSQNAGATFALASGDTNPQGIADPPAAANRPATPRTIAAPVTLATDAALQRLAPDAAYLPYETQLPSGQSVNKQSATQAIDLALLEFAA